MEMTNYASKGVANAGLATGIIGTSLGALNAIGGLGALSGVVGGRTTEHCINEDHCVNRYELNMTRENDRAIVEKDLIIAQKDSELALARAKENTREEIVSVYEQIKKEMNEQNDRNAALSLTQMQPSTRTALLLWLLIALLVQPQHTLTIRFRFVIATANCS